jgi:hypothetical protein
VDKVTEISRRRFVGSALSAVALAALPGRSTADAKMQKIGGDEMTSLTHTCYSRGNASRPWSFTSPVLAEI